MSFELDRREFLAAMAAVTATSILPACAHASVRQAQDQTPAAGLSERMEFGADYYAEDWPPERWETDAQLMRQAKFRTVRLADTNWERMEPAEDRYDFAWLDRVLEILNRNGIRAVLCTSIPGGFVCACKLSFLGRQFSHSPMPWHRTPRSMRLSIPGRQP